MRGGRDGRVSVVREDLRSRKTRNRAAGGSVLRSAKLLEVEKLEIEPPEAALRDPQSSLLA